MKWLKIHIYPLQKLHSLLNFVDEYWGYKKINLYFTIALNDYLKNSGDYIRLYLIQYNGNSSIIILVSLLKIVYYTHLYFSKRNRAVTYFIIWVFKQ